MDLNFLEYPRYHFRDRIGGNSRFQPNHLCRFCDRSIGGAIAGVFCSFGRIYLRNLYGKNRYNNLKEKVLRYGEVRDHCQLVSCLLEHHQRLDHEGKCSHWVVFPTISRLQPNHRYRFCDRSIGDGFVGFFCSFGRIYLGNLYGKNRYNNQKEKVLRYGEARDHYRLVSCLLEHHQRLDHEG